MTIVQPAAIPVETSVVLVPPVPVKRSPHGRSIPQATT